MNGGPDRTSLESRGLARSGLASFVGSAISAAMGFALTLVLARTLGAAGSGIVLQAVAVFTIVLSFARFGMDSAAVWIMPRLAVDDPLAIRGALAVLAIPTLLASTCIALILVLAAPLLDGGAPRNDDLAAAVSAASWVLPFGALTLVMLAAARGLGGIGAFVGVGSIGLPTIRLAAVWVVALLGGTYVGVTLAWAVPFVAALLAIALVLWLQVRRHEQPVGVGDWRPSRVLRRQIVGYAMPRTLSAGLEQSLIWFDVLFVGALLGPAAAGIYGGASRLVAAGLMIDSALRVVVSPRFSALIFAGRKKQLTELYRTAATWLVLAGAPVYLILAIFAPVVLGWLGPKFEAGSAVLAILCAGAILTFAAGNIHSLLLMGGRSGWGAVNKTIVLAVNIGANFALVPVLGIAGAALAWAVSMLLDAVLATIEVRRFVGVSVELRSVAYALAVPVLSVGAPALAFRLVWGASTTSMLVSVAVGGTLLVSWCVIDRRRLRFQTLLSSAEGLIVPN
jgi:O-antigen/teichoic acid export membrane protein